jgi:hypothetical protein
MAARPCTHPNMKDTAREDWCPDCGYRFSYGDAHAADPENRKSRLVNPGRDERGTLPDPDNA